MSVDIDDSITNRAQSLGSRVWDSRPSSLNGLGKPGRIWQDLAGSSRQDPGGTRKKVSQTPVKIWSGRASGACRIGSGTLPEHARVNKKPKNRKSLSPKWESSFLGTAFWQFWGPAGRPKSTKNEPRVENMRPARVPEATFFVFSCVAVRSRSPDRFVEGQTVRKSVRRATPNGTGKKKRQKLLPAPSPDALFRLRARFLSTLGSRPDLKN